MDVTAVSPPDLPELWGGVECTVNRVGDVWFDQMAKSGHLDRPDDLDRFAALGIRTLRYPVLWERVAPDRPDDCDWSRADDRVGRLMRLGVRPVVGLVHHGSGPRYTCLADPSFAEGLAAFAGRVAARFPGVGYYTPVNEPLTTARFSGLYGHWYPHACDAASFVRMLLNQCRAVVLSVRAIREVRGDAKLVQTEDLGKTYSTPALAYQAEFENERRWLTYDLLCGRVDRQHPLASYFRYVGIAEAEWLWFSDNPCPPDVLGVNHYVTSERFLDERVERYPAASRGGNGRHAYADVEAVRVRAAGPSGVALLLGEAWRRYGLPLAVTEAHLGCTREEQLRWLAEVWREARAARESGADVRAVTVWSLLGMFDWDSLVTLPRGHYEPGAFDVRGPRPRPTALAGLVRELAAGSEATHPVLSSPGWWRRPARLLYPAYPPGQAGGTPAGSQTPGKGPRPLVIVGAGGALGREFVRACGARGLAYRALTRAELDITRPAAVVAALEKFGPWAVINAAGFARVDAAESQPGHCHRANVVGPVALAAECARRRVPLMTFSSHLVFDGRKGQSYVESDATNPLSAYGRSKDEAERHILTVHPGSLVVRAGPMFSPGDERGLPARALRATAAGIPLAVPEDIIVTPSYAPDLVHSSLDLLIDGETGLWHLASGVAVSCLELARETVRRAGMDAGLIQGQAAAALVGPAPRPTYSALGSERGCLLPALESALERFCSAFPALETPQVPGGGMVTFGSLAPGPAG